MPANTDPQARKLIKSGTNWLLAAGLGVAAAALMYLLNPRKSRSKPAIPSDRSVDAHLRQPFPAQPEPQELREWTPVTTLVAGAVGGSFAMYSFRSLRRLQTNEQREAISRHVASTVGLRSAGR